MNLLFFARDPGGAALAASLVHACGEAGYSLRVYAKDYAQDAFARAGIAAEPFTSADAMQPAIDQAALLVTGTSYLDTGEMQLWQRAKACGTPSVALFDHWMHYRRFTDPSTGQSIFPDAITVNDACAAKGLAKAYPKCPAQILPLGNPLLELLRDGAPTESDVTAFRSRNRYADFTHNLLYAAEKIKGYPVQEAFGIDEFSQFETLLEACRNVDAPVRLLFRPHPKHDPRMIETYLETCKAPENCRIELDASTDKRLALAAADLVLGIHTMVLVEAQLLGTPGCSIQTGMLSRTPFDLIEQGLIRSATTPEALRDTIMGKQNALTLNSDVYRGSRERILRFIAQKAGRA